MHRYPAVLVLGIYALILLIWGPRPTHFLPATQEHYFVEISGDGTAKKNTIQYPVDILGYTHARDSLWVPCPVSGHIYLAIDSLKERPVMGNQLMCHMALHPVYHSGVCYKHQFERLPKHDIAWDKRSRIHLHNLFKRLGFKGDILGLIEALTIGQKTALSRIQKQHFAQTGVSHVLALSGLHIGLLASLFLWRERYDKRRSRRWMRLILMLGTLGTFTILAGGAASLCRAMLLIIVFYLGRILYQQITPINVLASVGFILLIYHPIWLFDLGFQLSMLAVVGLFTVYPAMRDSIPCKHVVTKRLWDFTAVTLSAQMITLPLTLPTFHTLPIYSPISNLLILPQLCILLYSLIVLIACSIFPPAQTLLAEVVKWQSQLLLQTINWINGWPIGVWTIEMHPLESIPWIIAILWGGYLLRKPTWLKARPWLVFILVLLSAHYALLRV